MLVTETAKSTFVGKTASLVSGENRKGHFQIVMTQIGTALLIFVVVWLLIVWIGGFFRSVGISRPEDNNLLTYSLIFLIIGVPVGLPCVTTTTLAVGAAYLAKRQAIVQKLTAIEALAGVDILCSDKTGTLTANKLSIDEPYVCEGVEMEWMMAVAALASSHSVKSLDPIDKVTIQTLSKYPKAQDHLRQGWTTQKFTPFDPVSKRITAEVSKDGKNYIAAKGAPNAILKLCQPPKEEADSYRARTMTFAKRGFRSLGVALHEDGKWKLLGLLPMFDPPRGDTAAVRSISMLLNHAHLFCRLSAKLVYSESRLRCLPVTPSQSQSKPASSSVSVPRSTTLNSSSLAATACLALPFTISLKLPMVSVKFTLNTSTKSSNFSRTVITWWP